MLLLALAIALTTNPTEAQTNTTISSPSRHEIGLTNIELFKSLQLQLGKLINKLQDVSPWTPAPPWQLTKKAIYKRVSNPITYKEVIEYCGRITARLINPTDISKINFTADPTHTTTKRYIIEMNKTPFLNTIQAREQWVSKVKQCTTVIIPQRGQPRYRPIECTTAATAICIQDTTQVQQDIGYKTQIQTIKQMALHLTNTADPRITQVQKLMSLNTQIPIHPITFTIWTNTLQATIEETKAAETALPEYPDALEALIATIAMQTQIDEITILAITQHMTYYSDIMVILKTTMEKLNVQARKKATNSTDQDSHAQEMSTLTLTQQRLGSRIGAIEAYQTLSPNVTLLQAKLENIQSTIQSISNDAKTLEPSLINLTSKVTHLQIDIRQLQLKVQEIQRIQHQFPRVRPPLQTNNKSQKVYNSLQTQLTKAIEDIHKIGQCASCTIFLVTHLTAAGLILTLFLIPAICLYRKLSRKLSNTRAHLELSPLDPTKALIPNIISRLSDVERHHRRHLINYDQLVDKYNDLYINPNRYHYRPQQTKTAPPSDTIATPSHHTITQSDNHPPSPSRHLMK